MAGAKTKQQLAAENEELRARLQELEETLEAIRSGAVDAIVMTGPAGERVYTLEGADRAYRTMVESMSEGAVTMMTDGTILYANGQFVAMTGSSPEEITGRRIHDFVTPSDRTVLEELIRDAGSASKKSEIRLVRPSDTEVPVLVSVSPIDLQGSEARTLVVMDLSENKRLEDIVAAERLSWRILEQAQEGIAVCIDGHIVRANDSLYRICGNIPLMQPFDDIFAFESSNSKRFSVVIPLSGKSIRNEEVRYRRPDGTCFDLLLSAGPLFGSRGEVLGCLISLMDVTGIKRAEHEVANLNRELRQKIQNLEAIFETAPIGLAITEDPEGLRIRGNPANELILGVPRGSELSKRLPEPARFRILQDGRELAVEELPMQRAARGESVSNLVLDLVREDGRAIKLFSNASPLFDEQGRPRGAVGAFLDITELDRAQEALRESEERYRALINMSPDAIVVHRDGQILFVNEAALRLYGAADPGQLQSRNIVDQLHPDDRDRARERIRRVQSGVRTELREARLLRIDGVEVPIEAMAGPVEYAGERAVQVVLRDITVRKKAEQALRDSEERYRSLFDTMTEGFALHEIVTDAQDRPVDYRFLDVNSSFERLTGLKREDLVGRLLTEAVPGEDPDWIARYGKVALTGEPFQEEKYSAALGRWYQVFSYRTAPRQFAVIFMDVTERRQLEKESRRLLEAVQGEKDRLAALINSMNDEVWLADMDGNFRLVNPRAMREFGFEDAGSIDIEKLAASLEIFRPDGTPRPVEEAPPLRALQGELVRSQEEIIRTPSGGALRYREVNSSPIRDAGGGVIGSVSVVRDITDRKRSEAFLKADLDALVRMHSLSGRLLGAEGFRPLLQEVMDAAVSIAGAQRGTLQLIEGDILRIVAHHGHEPPFLEFFASAVSRDSACGEALLRGERVVIPDVEESPLFAGTPSLPVLRAACVRAVQSTPMVGRTGRTVGILTTQWVSPHQPGDHDLWRIDLLTRQAADLIEQVQAQEALQRSAARFRLLSETAGKLLAAEDPQALIDSLCREVMGHLDCQAFFNFMVDEAAGRLRLNACAGIPEEETRKLEWLDYGVAVCGCVARDGVRIIAEDIFHTPDARTELVKSYGIQAYCCHPMKIQERLIGTLSFGTKTRARFTPDEVELMRTVADQVAVALERVLAQRELRRSKDDLEVKVRERTAELNYMMGELEKSRDDLRRLAAELVMAEEMERKRIAVTLHDEVAQTLAAAKMRLDMLHKKADSEESRRVFDEVRHLLGQSIRETRALMSDISSPVLYDMGLPTALQALADQAASDHGVSVSCSIRGHLGNLSTELTVMMYQMVRELLQNIVKHSLARNATIRIAREDDAIRTTVSDDGRGFDLDGVGKPGRESGFGLFSIRERVKSFHGSLEIDSGPDRGTVVTVILPVSPPPGHESGRTRELRKKGGRTT